MAASKREVSAKGVHCITKLGSSHSKSRQNDWNNPVKGIIF